MKVVLDSLSGIELGLNGWEKRGLLGVILSAALDSLSDEECLSVFDDCFF